VTNLAGQIFDRWWPRLRDVISLVVGVYLLYTQNQRVNPSEAFVTIGALLLVVPTASLAQRWLRGKIEEQ
jgi:hypothetical protein